MAKRFIFTYLFCNNLELMKEFYSEFLGLELIWEDTRSIAYKIEDHQVSITLDKEITPFSSKFSKQPGWQGGTVSRVSWSLECDKDDFLEIVESIKEYPKVKAWNQKPIWVGYWSFPVLDPMNQTIEITCSDENILLE